MVLGGHQGRPSVLIFWSSPTICVYGVHPGTEQAHSITAQELRLGLQAGQSGLGL